MKLKEIGKAKTSEKIEEILYKSELPYIPITYYNHDGFFSYRGHKERTVM